MQYPGWGQNLPQDLELSLALGGRDELISLHPSICHGQLNSCQEKSKSGWCERPQTTERCNSGLFCAIYLHSAECRVLDYGLVKQSCGLVGHKCGEG